MLGGPMNLLIDDIRDFNVDIIARTGEAGLEILGKLEFEIEIVYFDHDLGDGISGYTTLRVALERGYLDKSKVILVTSNPVGKVKMECILKDYGFELVRINPYESYWEKNDE